MRTLIMLAVILLLSAQPTRAASAVPSLRRLSSTYTTTFPSSTFTTTFGSSTSGYSTTTTTTTTGTTTGTSVSTGKSITVKEYLETDCAGAVVAEATVKADGSCQSIMLMGNAIYGKVYCSAAKIDFK
jgi:hypothetical protein